MDLEQIEKITAAKAGLDVTPVVRVLYKKKDFSEFKIAEAIDLNINQARSLLYKLNSHGFASFIRKKDLKKGWYICYWTLQTSTLERHKAEIGKDRLFKLKEKLKMECETQFFICREACMRLDFDNAFSMQFKCPECGLFLDRVDNSKTIEKLKKEIEDTESSASS